MSTENVQTYMNLVQHQLGNTVVDVDRAVDNGNKALARGGDAAEKLEVAIQDVSGYIQKSGEALDAGRNTALDTRKAQGLLATVTVGDTITDVTEHAKNAHEHSQRAAEKRDEAISHGKRAIQNLTFAASGVAAYILYTGDGARAAETALGALKFSKQVLDQDIKVATSNNDSAKSMNQKIEKAVETSGQYWLDLNTAKDCLVDVTGPTSGENEGDRYEFDAARHDVGDLRFLIERLKTGVERLLGSVNRPTPEFNQLLELVHAKVTDSDIQYLNNLLARTKRGIEYIAGTTEERESLAALVRGAKEDGASFKASL